MVKNKHEIETFPESSIDYLNQTNQFFQSS